MTEDNSTEKDFDTDLKNELSEQTTTESTTDEDDVTESENQDDIDDKEKDVCTDLQNCDEVSFVLVKFLFCKRPKNSSKLEL